MFKLKMRKVEFFKGDRELPWWYILIPVILLLIIEYARIFKYTPEHIELRVLRFLPPSAIAMFLDILVQVLFVGTIFYLAFRYLSKWLIFIFVPLIGIVAEYIYCRGDIAAFGAAQGIPVNLVIPSWAGQWLLFWVSPYYIIKVIKRKNVPESLLILGGIMAFLMIGMTPVLGILLIMFLIATGVVYRYKPHYLTKLKSVPKSVPFWLIVLGILVFIGGSSLSDALNRPDLGGIGLILGLFLIASGVVYWIYKRRSRKRKK